MNQAAANPSTPGGTRLVFIALGLALVAVIVVNLYINHIKTQVAAESFTMYRLNRSLEPGDVFKDSYVDAVQVPLRFRSSFEGFVMDAGLASVRGDTVYRSARQGQFLTSQVFTPQTGGGEYRRPRIGKRFIKLSINPRNVPGNLQPEMEVDILAPFTGPGQTPVVLPVMEQVRVIAVGTRTAEDEDDTPGRPRRTTSFHNITIEVSPEEAIQFSMIEKLTVGDFELHLRNPSDESHPNIPGGGINPKVLELIDAARRAATR